MLGFYAAADLLFCLELVYSDASANKGMHVSMLEQLCIFFSNYVLLNYKFSY